MNRFARTPRPQFSLALEKSGHRRAFSLLELMVVVAIIIVLVALTLAVITPILLKNEERVTRNVLAQLDAAMTEWERVVDRRVTFSSDTTQEVAGNVWDVPVDPNLVPLLGAGITNENAMSAPFGNNNTIKLPAQRTVWLMELIGREANVRELLAKIPSQYFRNVKATTVGAQGEFLPVKCAFDAWGNPIIAVFPGREVKSTDPVSILRDLDGTIRSSAEDGTTPATTGFGICRNRQVLFVSAGPDGNFLGTGAADNLYSYGEAGQ